MALPAQNSAFACEGQLTDIDAVVAFIEAGNAIFTIKSKKTNARFTFRVRAAPDGAVKFVALLNGPDNCNSYTYIGYIKNGVYFHGGAKSKVNRQAPSNLAFEWTYKRISQHVLPVDALEIWHEGKCGRCGRKLTVPASIQSGIGPECARNM